MPSVRNPRQGGVSFSNLTPSGCNVGSPSMPSTKLLDSPVVRASQNPSRPARGQVGKPFLAGDLAAALTHTHFHIASSTLINPQRPDAVKPRPPHKLYGAFVVQSHPTSRPVARTVFLRACSRLPCASRSPSHMQSPSLRVALAFAHAVAFPTRNTHLRACSGRAPLRFPGAVAASHSFQWGAQPLPCVLPCAQSVAIIRAPP
jgi:hypothetical protein